MTDPRRLRDGGEDFERALLATLRLDEPTDDERRRVLAVLGVTLPGATVLPPATLAKPLGWLGGGKSAAVGVLAVAGGIYVAVGLARRDEPVMPPPHAVSATPVMSGAPLVPPIPPVPSEPDHVDVVDVASLPVAPPVVAPFPAVSHTAPPRPADSSLGLAEEIALIDQARRALAEADPTGALALLDHHRESHGKLAHEATALRVEALAARGETAEAERVARAFLAEHPKSPLAQRIRSLAHLDHVGSIP